MYHRVTHLPARFACAYTDVSRNHKTLSLKFSDLGLSSELSRAVADLGYEYPTPIQEKSIPVVLMGRDILGSANWHWQNRILSCL